jgi:hypothetical protein
MEGLGQSIKDHQVLKMNLKHCTDIRRDFKLSPPPSDEIC